MPPEEVSNSATTRVFDQIYNGKSDVLMSSKFLDLLKHFGGRWGGGGVIVRSWRVICENKTQMKVIFWRFFPL